MKKNNWYLISIVCIGCHTAVKDNDWVFVGPVK
jgi:hypothetical protein